MIDTDPFGANIPSIGVNANSGTAISAHTPLLASLSAAQINKNWNLAGPVSPSAAPTVINGVNYTGVTCTFTGESGVVGAGNPCDPIAVNPNYQISTPTAEYNIDIQRAASRAI